MSFIEEVRHFEVDTEDCNKSFKERCPQHENANHNPEHPCQTIKVLLTLVLIRHATVSRDTGILAQNRDARLY